MSAAEDLTLETLFVNKEAPVAKTPVTSASERKASAAKDKPSIKELILNLYRADPEREYSANQAVERLKVKHPDLSESSAYQTVNFLKNDGFLQVVRKEGRTSILRAHPKPPAAPNKAKATPAAKKTGRPKGVPGISAGSVKADLAILKDAAATLRKLEALIKRNESILAQIQKFKSLL